MVWAFNGRDCMDIICRSLVGRGFSIPLGGGVIISWEGMRMQQFGEIIGGGARGRFGR